MTSGRAGRRPGARTGRAARVDGITARHDQEALVADDDAALVDGIVRLLQDTDLRQKLSRNGRALIEVHYSWARVATLYEDLYHDVITRNVTTR